MCDDGPLHYPAFLLNRFKVKLKKICFMGFFRSIFLLVLSAVAFGLPQLLQFRIGAAIKYFLIEAILFGFAFYGGILTAGVGSVIGLVVWVVVWLRVYEDAKYHGRH